MKKSCFFQVGKLEADCNHWCGGRSGRCPNNCLGCPLGSRLVITYIMCLKTNAIQCQIYKSVLQKAELVPYVEIYV